MTRFLRLPMASIGLPLTYISPALGRDKEEEGHRDGSEWAIFQGKTIPKFDRTYCGKGMARTEREEKSGITATTCSDL